MSNPKSIYKSYKRPSGQSMKLLGHRGLSCKYPENTLQSVLACYRCGADGYEVDIQGTLDKAIVLHDPQLKRTAKGWMPTVPEAMCTDAKLEEILETPVHQLPFRTTQMINVGTLDCPEAPPALDSFLATMFALHFFGLLEVKINIAEAKPLIVKGFQEAVYKAANIAGVLPQELANYIGVISFDDMFLEEQSALLKEVNIPAFWIREFNVDKEDKMQRQEHFFCQSDLERAKELGVNFNVESCEEAKEYIPQIKQAGFSVGTWVKGPNVDRGFLGTDGDYYANLMKDLECEFFTSNLPADLEVSQSLTL